MILLRKLALILILTTAFSINVWMQDPPWKDSQFDISKYDFTARTLDGDQVRLSSYRGKVILLNFWATWCGPCRVETPSLVRLYEKLSKNHDVVFLAVAVWDNEDAVRSFREEYEIPYLIVNDADEEIATQYQADVIPQSYLIGPDGRLFQFYEGLVFEGELETKIKELLTAIKSAK